MLVAMAHTHLATNLLTCARFAQPGAPAAQLLSPSLAHRPAAPRRIWAQASAALAASSLLLADGGGGGGERGEGGAYAAALLRRAVQLYDCAMTHNPSNATLQASLPAVLPQYRSNGFSDELGWAAAWLHTATAEERYALDFQANMRRGEDRWYYEGWAASWDDVNALAKLRMLLSAPGGFAPREHLLQSVRAFVLKWSACTGAAGPPTATGCGLCWLNRWGPLRYALTAALLGAIFATHLPDDEAARARTSNSPDPARAAPAARCPPYAARRARTPRANAPPPAERPPPHGARRRQAPRRGHARSSTTLSAPTRCARRT